MDLQITHLVAKKVDETGFIKHWFVLNRRPKGMFHLSLLFEFENKDFTFPAQTISFKSMSVEKWKEQQKLMHKPIDPENVPTFGVFQVSVFQGLEKMEKVVKITAAAVHGVIKKQVVQGIDISVTESFQNIVEEEKIFDELLKKL